jgi:hypothetical protein
VPAHASGGTFSLAGQPLDRGVEADTVDRHDECDDVALEAALPAIANLLPDVD